VNHESSASVGAADPDGSPAISTVLVSVCA
jgi:hypothetical protein